MFEIDDTVTSIAGAFTQIHVMLEVWVMVKVTEVLPPLDGTEPVPVHPVQE
jgi:hypothetical protein